MQKTEVDVWRSGTGKVIAVGDVVYTDPSVRGSKGSYRYKVKAIRTFDNHRGQRVIEVEVYGGKPPMMRTFRPDVLHRAMKAKVRA